MPDASVAVGGELPSPLHQWPLAAHEHEQQYDGVICIPQPSNSVRSTRPTGPSDDGGGCALWSGRRARLSAVCRGHVDQILADAVAQFSPRYLLRLRNPCSRSQLPRSMFE